MKATLISIVVIILLVLGGYYYYMQQSATITANGGSGASAATTESATSTAQRLSGESAIGKSVGGNDIMAYRFGTGAKEILFVAGLHGGYEWNTVALADQLIQYLEAHPETVPADETVTVIPVANPDGLAKVVGTTSPAFDPAAVTASLDASVKGRFNDDGVDLNRNFDCDWQAQGVWQNTPVSGGSAAFSEPESQAIRDFVSALKPTAVVAWYSAAGGVYPSSCDGNPLPETSALSALYAQASGYPASQSFDAYATTGDMTNWLAKEGIPAISVLLTNHTDPEWSKNLPGIQALLSHYAS